MSIGKWKDTKVKFSMIPKKVDYNKIKWNRKKRDK